MLESKKIATTLLYNLVILCFLLTNCENRSEKMNTPKAEKVPYSFELHGEKIIDNYAWLRDKNWPNVKDKKIIDYLKSENNYFESFFSPLKDKKESIFQELKSRIKLDDQSTYIKRDNYYYYTKTSADNEYSIYCRKEGSMESAEEILLDVNALAKGKSFVQLGAFSVSPDHKLMGYSVDYSGNERYTIVVYDLINKKYLSDQISSSLGSVIWHENLNGFFYTKANELWRTDKLFFHKLGTDESEDALIFHEPDPLYSVSIDKSSSRNFIFIDVSGHECNEIYVIKMDDGNFLPTLLKPKKDKILYSVDHNGDYFYIYTNEQAKNFKLMRVSVNNFQKLSWEEYIEEDKSQYLSYFNITKNYLILNYKNLGLNVIKIRNLTSGVEKIINFPDKTYVANGMSTNFLEDDIRVSYSSLARPDTIYAYDFKTEDLKILKVQEIPSGFNPDEYEVERVFAENKGTKVPISLFYKKSLFKKDGTNPLYLYGYGSYGISISASFRISAISLVDRGFVFAIAHIRGGDDLGYEWYEAAKFLTKKLTFSDFISTAEHLISEKYTNTGNIAISGGSAGGLLIGAVINEKPQLFKSAIAHVPFVDVLNTMLDETLPLTPSEFKEWGNPKNKEYFDYIKSYSPYDNVKPQKYPSLFVTAGLSDPRVGYWEAAKWVAKIRDYKTDSNIIIFKTNMDYGHSGASGRFDYLKEIAEDLTFILESFDL